MEKKTHVIVASVILSVLVWLSVSMNNRYSVAVRVPFRVSDLSDGISLARKVPRYIVVKIRGTGWQLASSYLSTTASVNFDASSLTRGSLLLTSRDLGYSLDVGSSAEVIGFQPDTILISVDSTISKKVPVIPSLDVTPREGFTIVGSPSVDPDSVTVTGARRLLNRIVAWQTRPRKFNRVINQINATLALSDTLSGIVSVDARDVKVRVDVEQVADNTYKDVPVTVANNFDSTRILLLPPAVDIIVRGGINEMADLTSDSFKVTVDYQQLIHSPSSYIAPTIESPEELTVIGVKPDSIEFIIRK